MSDDLGSVGSVDDFPRLYVPQDVEPYQLDTPTVSSDIAPLGVPLPPITGSAYNVEYDESDCVDMYDEGFSDDFFDEDFSDDNATTETLIPSSVWVVSALLYIGLIGYYVYRLVVQ